MATWRSTYIGYHGTVEVLDEEEFAQRCDKGHYPNLFHTVLPAAAAMVAARLRAGDEPFAGTADRYLEQLVIGRTVADSADQHGFEQDR